MTTPGARENCIDHCNPGQIRNCTFIIRYLYLSIDARCLHFFRPESAASIFAMTGACREMGQRRTSSLSAATLPSAVSHILIASLQLVAMAKPPRSAATERRWGGGKPADEAQAMSSPLPLLHDAHRGLP
jgi:hypothetical protein